MPLRQKRLLREQRRERFAFLFGVVPNVTAFIGMFVCLYLAAYWISFLGFLTGPFETIPVIVALPVSILLDALVAYSVTGTRNKSLSVLLLIVYVVITRAVGFMWVGLRCYFGVDGIGELLA